MNKKIISILACPSCRTSLEIEVLKEGRGRIREGNLRCKRCRKSFVVRDEIVCFAKGRFGERRSVAKKVQKLLEEEFRDRWKKHFTKQEFTVVRDQWSWMIRNSDLRRSEVHLDWGTGTARFLRNVTRIAKGEIIALEIDYVICLAMREFLKRVGKYANITIVCADARKMPFASGSINSVTSWHGFDEPGTDKAVSESKRVLKRDGHIAASGLFYEEGSKSIRSALKWKIKFAKEDEAPKCFRKVGFRDIEYRIFLKSKWLDRTSYLPKYGDYYSVYGISGRK